MLEPIGEFQCGDQLLFSRVEGRTDDTKLNFWVDGGGFGEGLEQGIKVFVFFGAATDVEEVRGGGYGFVTIGPGGAEFGGEVGNGGFGGDLGEILEEVGFGAFGDTDDGIGGGDRGLFGADGVAFGVEAVGEAFVDHVIDGEHDRRAGLVEGAMGELSVVGGMENIEGGTIGNPAKVCGLDAVGNPMGPKAAIFFEAELGMGGIMAVGGVVGGGEGGVSGGGKSIDDVGEVAVDAAGGLGGVDLAIVENLHNELNGTNPSGAIAKFS